MELSYNWLKQYVDIADLSPQQIQDYLTNAGLEVEGYEVLGQGTNLVVGEVLSVSLHPDSDHLHVCQVQVPHQVLQIVCGAANVAANQKVIVAQVGAKLPAITIEETKIRQVASAGMICSLSELGVAKKRQNEASLAGIEVLPAETEIGADPLAVLGLDDVIFDVSLTPNRSDCLALWSMAIEMGAVAKREVKLPRLADLNQNYRTTKLEITSYTEKCQKFVGQVVNKLTVGPSPTWLKQALHAVGIKSINNVVDISNYVMIETGQPLHFYDLKKLTDLKISVTDQEVGSYQALDGITYEIKAGDLLIKSGEKTVGIAGIMGGDDSKIEATTQGILIEAAIFEAVAIRQTARRLNLATEASIRFQKGLDPLAPEKAVSRAIELLKQLASADQIEQPVIYDEFNYQPREIAISLTTINQRLGTSFTLAEVSDVFTRLKLSYTLKQEEYLVQVPSYRTDLVEAVDLTEEVIRIIGYDQITANLPLMSATIGGYQAQGALNNQIRRLISGMGFQEVISYSLVSHEQLADGLLQLVPAVQIANPLSNERSYYRTSLLASMLETISYNQARYLNEWSLFEIGNVYSPTAEATHLMLATSATKTLSKWQNKLQPQDFYYLKGLLTSVLKQLGYSESRLQFSVKETSPLLHPHQQAQLFLDKKLLATLGIIHPQVAERYQIDQTLVAEIDLSLLINTKPARIQHASISKYPSVSYDLALVVAHDVPAQDLIKTIKQVGGKLVVSSEIFDVYQGEHIADGYKSIAIRVVYQASDHTLKETEVMPIQTAIIEALKNNYQADIRSK